jgi:hypothetical protein
VRAALTMTTSSDMDISFDVLGLEVSRRRAAGWRACLSPHPVNVVEPCQSAKGQNRAAAHSK